MGIEVCMLGVAVHHLFHFVNTHMENVQEEKIGTYFMCNTSPLSPQRQDSYVL